LIGFIIGALALLIRPGREGLGIATLLGLAGQVIGGVVENALGTGEIFELNVLGLSSPSSEPLFSSG